MSLAKFLWSDFDGNENDWLRLDFSFFFFFFAHMYRQMIFKLIERMYLIIWPLARERRSCQRDNWVSQLIQVFSSRRRTTKCLSFSFDFSVYWRRFISSISSTTFLEWTLESTRYFTSRRSHGLYGRLSSCSQLLDAATCLAWEIRLVFSSTFS